MNDKNINPVTASRCVFNGAVINHLEASSQRYIMLKDKVLSKMHYDKCTSEVKSDSLIEVFGSSLLSKLV